MHRLRRGWLSPAAAFRPGDEVAGAKGVIARWRGGARTWSSAHTPQHLVATAGRCVRTHRSAASIPMAERRYKGVPGNPRRVRVGRAARISAQC